MVFPEDRGRNTHLPSVLLILRQFIEVFEPVVDEIAISVEPSHHLLSGRGVARQHRLFRW